MKERHKHKSITTLLEEADDRISSEWGDMNTRIQYLPGKEFISIISAKAQKLFGSSVTIRQLINEMRASEVPGELAAILQDVEAYFSS